MSNGYEQALDNYAYQINLLAAEIESLPGDPLDHAVDLMGRGEVYKKFRPIICQLDYLLPIICETYNKTEQEVENDVQYRLVECALKHLTK